MARSSECDKVECIVSLQYSDDSYAPGRLLQQYLSAGRPLVFQNPGVQETEPDFAEDKIYRFFCFKVFSLSYQRFFFPTASLSKSGGLNQSI